MRGDVGGVVVMCGGCFFLLCARGCAVCFGSGLGFGGLCDV